MFEIFIDVLTRAKIIHNLAKLVMFFRPVTCFTIYVNVESKNVRPFVVTFLNVISVNLNSTVHAIAVL